MNFRPCVAGGEGNLPPRRPPRKYLGEYTSWGKPKIPPADQILMDPGHKARKNPSDNADLGFQAVGPALRIMQLNVEGLSAAKRPTLTETSALNSYNNIEYPKNRMPWNRKQTLSLLLYLMHITEKVESCTESSYYAQNWL